MAGDRISEAYNGKLDESMKEKSQRRINWFCDKVKGENVLDIGCSQGILPILLGRKNKNVIGIDNDINAINYALEAQKREEQSVQEKIKFIYGDFLIHDFEEKFDTVVMGEILEHLFNPQLFLKKASTLLKKDGVFLASVPFGINRYPDHKRTYYFYNFYNQINEFFKVHRVIFMGKWIAIIAYSKESEISEQDRTEKDFLEEYENAVYFLEESWEEKLKQVSKYEQKKAEGLKKDLEKEVSKYEYERKKAEGLKKSLEKEVSKYEYEQKKAESLKKDLEKQTSKYEYEQKKAESLKKNLEEQVSKYEYEQKKAENLKEDLEKEVSKYEYEQKKAEGLKKDLEEQVFLLKEQHKRAEKLEEQLNEKIYEYKKESEQVKQLEEEKEFQRKQTDYFEERLKKKTSQFLYEQRKAEELKQKCNEYETRLSLYQKSKLFRLMLWKWKISSKTRFYLKKAIYTFGNKVYVKLLPYPKLRSFCSKVNRKLKLFKNPQEIVSYHRKKEETVNQNPKKGNANIKLKKPLEMNVAMIADEFTYNSFRYECNLFPLNPDNWKKILEEKEIDLFFCESAWAGIDPIKRPWKGQIYSSVNFKKENRVVLLEILNYCKENKIPTIFWNKEDPTHYSDKVHNFVDTAVKFDHIFTTDADCVEKYKKDYGHKSVHLLMFATQPKLFNPIEEFQRTEEIIFAGSWYQQHPARCEEMGGILDNIIASKYPLKIYNRHSETDDPNHIFPERFQEYLHPSLPHDQIKIAYKSSKYALNINTVTHSSSMFARRVFELMSSYTLVVSNYSKGMEELFKDVVVFVDGKHEIVIDQEEEKREKALYEVLSYHTYKQRFHQILKDINLSFIEEEEDITFLFEIRNEESAKNAYKKLQEIDYGNKKGIFYIKEECSEIELRHIVTAYNGFMINVISEDYCRKYEDILSIDTKYFIFADSNLSKDFARKAVLHFEYLENTIGITEGKDKFTFIKNEKMNNVLFSKNMFHEVKRTYSGIENMTFKIYQC